MITQIGVVSGKVLELLDQSHGVFVFGEIHLRLKEPRDLVMMGLGWLILQSYIHILEDPMRAVYKSGKDQRPYTSEASMFDLVVRSDVVQGDNHRIKNMTDLIDAAASRILSQLEEYGHLSTLQAFENNLIAHRDVILMGLGWLIRKEHVRMIVGTNETFIFRPPQEAAYPEAGSLCKV